MKNLKSFTISLVLVFSISYLCRGQENLKPSIDVRHLIDTVNLRLKNNYVFPEKADLIAKFLKSQVKKKTYALLSKDPRKLAEQIQADIYNVHRDPHMFVNYDPSFAERNKDAAKPNDEEMLENRRYWQENNYSFKKVELLPGNIGYFPFNNFVKYIKEAKPIIASALGFLSNSIAIIIDLRDNGGGEPAMVSQLESYFFKEKTHMNDMVNRSSKDTTFYYADPAKTDGLTLSMPIYILTSKKTFSAAEDFIYAMQQAKRAVVVGEVTGGGAHPQMPFSVGQGFVVHIPFARSLNPVTKTDWEVTGVIPEFKVDASKALVKAQELIFRKHQTSAKTENEKHKFEYSINRLYVNQDLGTLPLDQFDKFAGTYGPLVIYRDGNKLFCNMDGIITELAHISKNLFVLDEGAHIEFVKDSKGTYSMARLFVEHGGVFEEVRK